MQVNDNQEEEQKRKKEHVEEEDSVVVADGDMGVDEGEREKGWGKLR